MSRPRPDFDGPPLDPDAELPPCTPESEAIARAFLAARFPALADAPLSGSKCCRYELTPDAHFVAAPLPEHPSVWLLGGGSGHGFKHGPAIAERVAAALDGGAPLPGPLRAARPRPRRHVPHGWRHAPRRRRVGSMHDYLIVGAGSAGCALAARLTEDPDVSVLLVEAGPPDSEEALHIPAAFSQLYRTPFDWDYLSGPEPGLGGRELYVPRGRVLGGSSSLNAMIYIRGNPLDYAAWGPGWSWDEVLPYFLRAEDNERGASALHGAGGPLSVSDGRSDHPLARRVAARRRSTPGCRANDDFNGPAPGRRRPLPAHPARRHALLGRGRLPPPGARRPNLTLIPGAPSRGCCSRATRAVGAEALVDGVPQDAARRARGRAVRGRVQHAAAADAVGHRPGRRTCASTGSTSGSTSPRSARTSPTTSTRASSSAPASRR